MESTQSPIQPGSVPPESASALKVWNLMRGIDWAALPVLIELYGISEVDTLIQQLSTIRDYFDARK